MKYLVQIYWVFFDLFLIFIDASLKQQRIINSQKWHSSQYSYFYLIILFFKYLIIIIW